MRYIKLAGRVLIWVIPLLFYGVSCFLGSVSTMLGNMPHLILNIIRVIGAVAMFSWVLALGLRLKFFWNKQKVEKLSRELKDKEDSSGIEMLRGDRARAYLYGTRAGRLSVILLKLSYVGIAVGFILVVL